jgi:uncharacterized protein
MVTYLLLYAAVLCLWLPKKRHVPVWAVVFAVATCVGLITGHVDVVGLVWMALLLWVTYGLQCPTLSIFVRVLSAFIFLILAVGLQLHLLPGFHNLRVLNNVHVSQQGIPFSLYLNFDKTTVGIFILGMLHTLIRTKKEWISMLKTMLPIACGLMLMVGCLSFLFKFVAFEPKLPHDLFLWVCTNLLFVCVAEEGFFRGFIQKYLCLILDKVKFGNMFAIAIAALLFGLAHYAGGVYYMMLAAVAGLGYGFIYFKTGRIEASIITHFLLNLTHILFFTYPALAPQ